MKPDAAIEGWLELFDQERGKHDYRVVEPVVGVPFVAVAEHKPGVVYV